MKRITIAALAGAAVLFAGAANAQQPVDFSKVEVKTTDLGNKTYMLEGQGGNVTIAVGTDGVIMVDSQFAPMHDKLVGDGKLTSWGWAEHIIGGKYRRLATMTAPTMEALIAAREAIVAAAEHDPLNEVFTSICGSHQDYIWNVKDQGP